MDRWDRYFLNLCGIVASNSKCKSRQLGAILVRDKAIVATGYNGPARGVKHCGDVCPRRTMPDYKSGAYLEMCVAAHAETNCIASAARNGVCTKGCTLYLNWFTPCKDCLSILVNAGIVEIVCNGEGFYDDLSRKIVKESRIVVRTVTMEE